MPDQNDAEATLFSTNGDGRQANLTLAELIILTKDKYGNLNLQRHVSLPTGTSFKHVPDLGEIEGANKAALRDRLGYLHNDYHKASNKAEKSIVAEKIKAHIIEWEKKLPKESSLEFDPEKGTLKLTRPWTRENLASEIEAINERPGMRDVRGELPENSDKGRILEAKAIGDARAVKGLINQVVGEDRIYQTRSRLTDPETSLSSSKSARSGSLASRPKKLQKQRPLEARDLNEGDPEFERASRARRVLNDRDRSLERGTRSL